jgi:hypothetical protein
MTQPHDERRRRWRLALGGDERLGLKAMLMEPKFLATLEADVHLADLIALRAAMPAKAKDTARQVVRKVVDY